MTDTSQWPEGAAPVTIPAPAPHAAKAWAKALTGINPDAAADKRSKGDALDGVWLERGGTYALQPGVLVVTSDRVETRSRDQIVLSASLSVTLFQVTTGENGNTLTPLKTWTNAKGVLGAQILTGITASVKKMRDSLVRPGSLADITIAAPVRRNARPESCTRCGQEVPAGQGILSRAGDHAPWKVRHDGECPPPPAAGTPAARRNRKPGACSTCLQDVPAGAGVLHGGPGNWWVTHDEGACPPHPHNPGGAPLWRLSTSDAPSGSGVHAPKAGTVFRAEVWNDLSGEPPAPTAAPGLRRHDRKVTFIAVSVASAVERRYDHDEEEWFTYGEVLFRVASEEEAAPVLAREAKAERRRELKERTERLLATFRFPPRGLTDYDQPARGEFDSSVLNGLPRLPLPKGVGSPPPYETEAWLDEDRGVIWTAAHNGLDGDDWTPNNWGGYIVRSHPLTPERQRLVDDLIAEYDAAEPLAEQLRAPVAEVEALLAAGWRPEQIRAAARLFRLSEAGDGAALATRTLGQWEAAGWWEPYWTGKRFAPADAARLADAGVTAEKARKIGGAVEDILAAAPPQVPSDATRLLLIPLPGTQVGFGRRAAATDRPERMTRHLNAFPELWKSFRLQADVGPRPVHVTPHWQLWDDDMLTVCEWVFDYQGPKEEPPRVLTPAGERTLNILVASRGGTDMIKADKPHWLAVARSAERVDVEEIDSKEDGGHGAGTDATLEKITITRPGAPAEVLWRLAEGWWAWGSEDADADTTYTVYASEEKARAAYRAAKPA